SSVTLWGDGSPTREFLYVTDAAEAIVRATEHYDASNPVNIGTGKEVSVRDLVEKLARIVNYGGELVWDASKPKGQPRRRLDVSKAAELFGFTARVSLDEGLLRTVDWYLSEGQTHDR